MSLAAEARGNLLVWYGPRQKWVELPLSYKGKSRTELALKAGEILAGKRAQPSWHEQAATGGRAAGAIAKFLAGVAIGLAGATTRRRH